MEGTERKWTEVMEGSTNFTFFQDADRIYDASVFYNPKMVINRDLTLLLLSLVAKNSKEGIIFLDPFAGTGVRSYRILNELPSTSIQRIIASDKNPLAIEIINKNIDTYNYDGKLEVIRSEAYNMISNLVSDKQSIDVIDIDPFGSPISFLEISIRALQRSEGYLLVTATDLQVLCGKFSDACYRMYNAKPTRYFPCHEVALRILIYNLLISAGRLGVAIEPIFSFHHEHFLRVKVKIIESKELANEQHKKIGFVHFCTECSYVKSTYIPDEVKSSNCPVCMKKLEKAGPLWLGQLHSRNYVENMIVELDNFEVSSKKQIEKLLTKILDEIDSPPFFYYIPYILRYCGKEGISLLQLIESLQQNGFTVSRTVFNPEGLKTNASYSDIVEIVKLY